MEKIDLSREFKPYYTAKNNPEIVTFKTINYLALQGIGEPGGEEYKQKISAVYSLAYAVKFSGKEEGNDFVVPKLEGLYWVDGKNPMDKVPKSKWQWKLLIRMPAFVTKKLVLATQKALAKKKKNDLINEITFEKLNEKKCVQMMHVGPYDDMGRTVEVIMKFLAENKLSVNGLHHDIYISDPMKTDPAKLKTIVRYPVA